MLSVVKEYIMSLIQVLGRIYIKKIVYLHVYVTTNKLVYMYRIVRFLLSH